MNDVNVFIKIKDEDGETVRLNKMPEKITGRPCYEETVLVRHFKIRHSEVVLTEVIVRSVQECLIRGNIDQCVGEFKAKEWIDAILSYMANNVCEDGIDAGDCLECGRKI